ncbi:adenylate kinase 3 isoform 1-like protein [Camelus ferus]|nr:adenylate kinase 3 isoform 1-like protein [Camelus ferus]
MEDTALTTSLHEGRGADQAAQPVLSRLTPVRSEGYHLMYKPPPTMEIQARLLQNPKDAEERIKLRMDLFYRSAADLEQFYRQAITLNGDQDPYTVFEYIESGIINPLPKKVP